MLLEILDYGLTSLREYQCDLDGESRVCLTPLLMRNCDYTVYNHLPVSKLRPKLKSLVECLSICSKRVEVSHFLSIDFSV